MHRYCKYCAYCCEGDVYYCTKRQKVLTEPALKRTTSCPYYAYCAINIITGKAHSMKTIRRQIKEDNGSEQLRLEESL